MIFINPNKLSVPAQREEELRVLTEVLLGWPEELRAQFIEGHREEAWGHPEILRALRSIVGNKCWYCETHLEGADPNVDHFRPKGRVREVDRDLNNTKKTSDGYWWLAFDHQNYRLAAMHANQRRIDEDTAGGKWDYFPIRGERTAEGTPWQNIHEDALALDPCAAIDVALLAFDLDGNPCPATTKGRQPDPRDVERVRATIWLYHLTKNEISNRRRDHVQDIRKDLKKADADFRLWDRYSANPNLQARASFDQKIAEIKAKVSDRAVFAGAKRCTVRVAIADYPWIEEFNVI
jgi:hypothetical protein